MASGQFAVVFLIILIVQSTAAIYYLVVVPEDEGVNFKKALNNYIFRWEDRAYVDHIQNTVRLKKKIIYLFTHVACKYIKYYSSLQSSCV